jgi:hypothetical protein
MKRGGVDGAVNNRLTYLRKEEKCDRNDKCLQLNLAVHRHLRPRERRFSLAAGNFSLSFLVYAQLQNLQ